MKTLAVNTSRPYEIKIGRGSLDQAGVLCRQAIPNARKLTIVTDSRVLPLYLARTADSLEQMGFQIQCLTVPAGEASKSAEQLVILWEKMMAFGMTRTDAVVALGGGVVGDLAAAKPAKSPTTRGRLCPDPYHPAVPGRFLRRRKSGH